MIADAKDMIQIRCSGFESSPDGRCTNCVRFNQECMFTPVSSQAQAFVPAHAAYPHLLRPQTQGGRGRGYPGDNVVLYGAHGQPLPPQQQAMPESTLPPPQGAYYQAPYGRPPMDDRIPPPPMQHHMPHDQVSLGCSFLSCVHHGLTYFLAPAGRSTRLRRRL